ncbi:hypothetical protein [Candidatus Methanomassiliicoccus intestinalis]|uniref:hypothetical protein n=1 Tax=Candidatus Methanomassiliicoccus intestinalis TaxID=1406512 RepID=UPI0037DD5202
MDREKNTLPAAAAFSGGLLILFQGLIMTLIPLLSDFSSQATFFYGLFVTALGIISICLSYFIYKSYSFPKSALLLSVAVVSMIFAGGGFLIGSILTSIGGSLSMLSS